MALRKELLRVEKTKVFDRTLTYFYREYDKMYFGGRLPIIDVFYAPLPPGEDDTFRYGLTGFNYKNQPIYIIINKGLQRIGADTIKLVLLHEMCHVKLGAVRVAHGKEFKKERRRLILAGAFDELI